MKQRWRPWPLFPSPHLVSACATIFTLIHPFSLSKAYSNLHLLRNLFLRSARTHRIPIYFFSQLHVRFASLSHSDVSFPSFPPHVRLAFGLVLFLARSLAWTPTLCHPIITSNYGVSSVWFSCLSQLVVSKQRRSLSCFSPSFHLW